MIGETILCLSPRRWGSLWRDTQQYMSRLASSNRVIFVEPQRDPDIGYGANFKRASRYFGPLSIEQVMPNLAVIYTPPGLPYARQNLPAPVLRQVVPVVAHLNSQLLAWHLRRVVKALRVRRPILWLYDPRQVGLVGRFDEKLACYFNYDELADFAPNHHIRELLQAYDDSLCRRVQIVFATSQAQFQRRKKLNPHTHFVPNGVEFDLFHRALRPETILAPELSALPRPIIGLVGWLGHQIDVQLLLDVARAYPKASLVLVGPDALARDATYQTLRAQPNVHFLGQKALDELPSYLKGFDAAIIPYALSGHGHAIYPLKLHEYLAAGRSVLATDLPELRPFAPLIRLAATREAFVRAIPEAVLDHDPDTILERTQVARRNTWDERVAIIHRAIDAYLTAEPQTSPAGLGSLTVLEAMKK